MKEILSDNELSLSKHEKKMLIELISNKQIHMIIKDHTRYDSDKYKELERLKVKIKDVKEDAGWWYIGNWCKRE